MTAVRFSSGSAEALKWLALLAMTADHVNTYALDGRYPALFALGRIAFPIFAIVLACNMARPGANVGRLLVRLLAIGLVAAVPFGFLGASLPLNVMFTFALAAVVIGLIDQGKHLAAFAAFLLLPVFVDYQWVGVALVVSAWWYFRANTRLAAAALLVSWAALVVINGNFWALAAAVPMLAVDVFAPHVPRLRWAFYAYYPAHLTVLALVHAVMAPQPSV